MRNQLECAVAELICEMAVPCDINRLTANIQLQNFYLNSCYTDQLMMLDNQFHAILFEITRKSHIYSIVQDFTIHFDRVCSLAQSVVENSKIIQDYENVVHAIKNNDPKTARELMELHLNRYKIDTAAIRTAYPQYFK